MRDFDSSRIDFILDYAQQNADTDAFVAWWNSKAEADYGDKIYPMGSLESYCRNYLSVEQLIKADGKDFDSNDNYFVCVNGDYGNYVFLSDGESQGIKDLSHAFERVLPGFDYTEYVNELIASKSIPELVAELGIDCNGLREELAYQIGMEGRKLNISDEDIIKRNWNELVRGLKGR